MVNFKAEVKTFPLLLSGAREERRGGTHRPSVLQISFTRWENYSFPPNQNWAPVAYWHKSFSNSVSWWTKFVESTEYLQPLEFKEQ